MTDTGDLFPGFDSHWIDTKVGRIFARSKGSDPPLVLLHGFPQTHVCWHRIAPALAERHRVVCMDLRGYGWSSAPRGDAAHETYSKRAMGRDVIAVMEALGHVRFAVAGHDRGGRVAYRLALDEPGRIERLALLDILPTATYWEKIRAGTAQAPHWEFLARPAPEPETKIGTDPIAYVEGLLARWSRDGTLEPFDPRALAAYRQSANEPSRIHAFCEDYRAGATLDEAQDQADLKAARKITCPALIVWSDYLARGGVTETPPHVWRRTFAPDIAHARLSVGHFLAEEDPDGALRALHAFLGS